MRKRIALISLSAAAALAQDARTVAQDALKAIGDIRTVRYAGSGAAFNVGQNVNPSAPWPRIEIKTTTRTLDFERAGSRVEGAGPVQFVLGDRAWGQAGGNVTPAAPAVAIERRAQIWISPHGFLRGAVTHNAKMKRVTAGGRRLSVLSFTPPGGQLITGTVAPDGTVEKVETTVDNAVLGDMTLEAVYADYKDFGGFRFPTKIAQRSGGFPSLELAITAAQANVAVDIALPDAARTAVPPAVKAVSEKLADGVWYLTGGTHHSVAVEFAGHVAVIEAPQSEQRSLAVIAEVKKIIPSKPIRFLVNTHHHFDHSGGVRTYVAEGATVVTHQVHKAFYENSLKARRKINPDRQSQVRGKVRLTTFADRHVLSDGTRNLELHHIQGNPHHDGILMAYLPKEKILVEVDVYSPQPLNAPPPATPPPAAVNLYENIQRLKLDVGRIAALHGRVVALADLRKTIAR